MWLPTLTNIAPIVSNYKFVEHVFYFMLFSCFFMQELKTCIFMFFILKSIFLTTMNERDNKYLFAVSLLFRHCETCIYFNSLFYTGWSKKWVPGLIFAIISVSLVVHRFHSSFTDWLASKFAMKSILNIPPHLTNVATLPCKLLMSENSDNLKH